MSGDRAHCYNCKRETQPAFSMGPTMRPERVCSACAFPMPEETPESVTTAMAPPVGKVQVPVQIIDGRHRAKSGTALTHEDLPRLVRERIKYLRETIKAMSKELSKLEGMTGKKRSKRSDATVTPIRGAR